MRGKETDEPPVWKTVTQVRREHGLKRTANSPKVRDLEPTLTSRPHRHNHNDHPPVAHLHRQHLAPIDDPVAADENEKNDVVQNQYGGKDSNNDFFQLGGSGSPHDSSERKWQHNGEKNDCKMRQTVRVKLRRAVHRNSQIPKSKR